MDKETYDSYSVEDRLLFASRGSSAPYDDCKLMEEGSYEIERLRKEVAELKGQLSWAGATICT